MNGPEEDRKSQVVAVAIPIGAGAGVALGVVLMKVADNPGFLALGIAIGVTFGVAIGLALSARES